MSSLAALAGLVVGGVGGWTALWGQFISHNPNTVQAGLILVAIGLIVFFGLQKPPRDWK